MSNVAAVAEGVKGDPVAETVAILHDTVEDTSITIEDIRMGFPKEVADAVSALTHSKGISYAEYLWYIQQNSIAVKVKLSDLRSNMDLTRLPHAPAKKDAERTRKYKRAYTILPSANGVNAINPYALYNYLLARNWSVDRKSTRTPVLEAPGGYAEIMVPFDLALADYDTLMRDALDKLALYEGKDMQAVLDAVISLKPESI